VFKRKTVFILGAGASWHYGFPTGDALVKKIAQACSQLSNYCAFCLSQNLVDVYPKIVHLTPLDHDEDRQRPWRDAQAAFVGFNRRLGSIDPLLIDYFLGQNDDLRDIGRFLISWAIQECEEEARTLGINPNRLPEPDPVGPTTAVIQEIRASTADQWVRFVLHKILVDCKTADDIQRNNVDFITFNYDTSLETALDQGLSSTWFADSDGEKAAETARDFLAGDRVIHMYGKVRAPDDPAKGVPHNGFKNFDQTRRLTALNHGERCQVMDAVLEASLDLRTIDPHDKADNAEAINLAQDKIRKAEIIYILGYGFDERNSKRLGLDPTWISDAKPIIMFTNFGDSNRVNKKAGRVLLNDNAAFLPPAQPYQRYMKGATQRYIEKSVRNVYDALAFDFDELEDH
jgi:hypothetical protein